MIVVSDASPLIGLAAVGELRVLRDLYREVLIPEQVFAEASTPGRPGASEIAGAPWIRRRSVEDLGLVERLMIELDRGEAEAIALAVETRADALLLDERRARRVAGSLGVPVTGVLAVLVQAKSQGLVPAVGPIIDRMSAAVAFRISTSLYHATLRAAGE